MGTKKPLKKFSGLDVGCAWQTEQSTACSSKVPKISHCLAHETHPVFLLPQTVCV
jgi:hypothetical protein